MLSGPILFSPSLPHLLLLLLLVYVVRALIFNLIQLVYTVIIGRPLLRIPRSLMTQGRPVQRQPLFKHVTVLLGRGSCVEIH